MSTIIERRRKYRRYIVDGTPFFWNRRMFFLFFVLSLLCFDIELWDVKLIERFYHPKDEATNQKEKHQFWFPVEVISRLSSFHRIVELNLTYFHSMIVWKTKLRRASRDQILHGRNNIAWSGYSWNHEWRMMWRISILSRQHVFLIKKFQFTKFKIFHHETRRTK